MAQGEKLFRVTLIETTEFLVLGQSEKAVRDMVATGRNSATNNNKIMVRGYWLSSTAAPVSLWNGLEVVS